MPSYEQIIAYFAEEGDSGDELYSMGDELQKKDCLLRSVIVYDGISTGGKEHDGST